MGFPDPNGELDMDLELLKDMTFTMKVTFPMKGPGQEQSGTWCVWRGRAWTLTRELRGTGKMAFLTEWTLAGTSLRTALIGRHILMTRRDG
jgi:hypothetical protein